MPTATGGTLTITRDQTLIRADGSMIVNLLYANAGGTIVHSRSLTVAADRSTIIDEHGIVIVTPSPVALNNAITAFLTQLDTTIANGATGGKLNL